MSGEGCFRDTPKPNPPLDCHSVIHLASVIATREESPVRITHSFTPSSDTLATHVHLDTDADAHKRLDAGACACACTSGCLHTGTCDHLWTPMQAQVSLHIGMCSFARHSVQVYMLCNTLPHRKERSGVPENPRDEAVERFSHGLPPSPAQEAPGPLGGDTGLEIPQQGGSGGSGVSGKEEFLSDSW
jgi:hypothetical protein